MFNFLFPIVIIIVLLRLPHVKNEKCLKLFHESGEFRVSGGDYDPDEVTPSQCQELCGKYNFSYAAIMVEKFCLCSYTNDDYPDVDDKCCGPISVKCDSDSDTIVAMEVNDPPDISVFLETEVEAVGMRDVLKIIVDYDVVLKSNVMSVLRLYYDDQEIDEPVTGITPEFRKKMKFMNCMLPGLHTARVVAIDDATETVMVLDEVEIFIPDTKVSFDLSCPESARLGEDIYCNVSVQRGTDLNFAIQFGSEEPENYIVPDCVILPIGPSIPYVSKPSVSELPTPPEITYLSTGELPFSTLIGFDFFALIPQKFEVQILHPKCDGKDNYCSSTCQPTCPEKGEYFCSEETESFCSESITCANINDQPTCSLELKDNYIVKHSIEIDLKLPPGYIYHPLETKDYVEIEPGYIIALKREQLSVIMYEKATEDDIRLGLADKDEAGQTLDIRHLFRAIILMPTNISFVHNFTEAGHYKIRAKLTSDFSDDLVEEKETEIEIESLPISGLKLSESLNCTKLDDSLSLKATVETGVNVTFRWVADEHEDRVYTLEDTSDAIVEKYTCSKEGNFTVVLNASDKYAFENVSTTFCCINSVSRKWELKADSPQLIPPGEINYEFTYTGSDTYFPLGSLADFDFGDGELKTAIAIDDEKKSIIETHSYEKEGSYNVSVRVYNSFDEESFTTEVKLLAVLGILEVHPYYKMEEEDEPKDLHGKSKTDVPVNSLVSFSCNIPGSVDNYIMKIEDEITEHKSSDATFSRKFDTVGEYTAIFTASNILEESHNVSLNIRVMSETEGLQLEASASEVLLDEEFDFTISFKSIDQFTCITFDAGDGEVKHAFGSENMCNEMIQSPFQFHSHHSKRKRRAVEEASWVDDASINIPYAYRSGGIYKSTAKAFNTIFSSNATAEVKASYPPSSIWIENNSTNINRPMKFFREENFRLETTAILFDRPSNFYEMSWQVDKITESDSVIETIDIADIRSSNCSAIRFPRRYLQLGLYKVTYFVDIFEDGNLTAPLSCFTYLEIMSSPLRAMIIKGGASYILRGYEQLVYLEASKYSEDPDEPEEKEFEVEWSCRSFDPGEFLGNDEEYNEDLSLSEKAVTFKHIEKANANEECFKESKDKEILKGANLVVNTGDLLDYSILYEIVATVSKGKRKKTTRIYLDVIEDVPPGIIIMCEKSVACHITEQGFLVNPTNFLAIRAECVTECGDGQIDYDWEIYAVDESTNDKIPIDDWKESIILDEDRLGINVSFFQKHEDFRLFHVQVRGTDAGKERPTGVAKLYLTINKPPTPGSCTISNDTGLAMTTIFKLDFTGWLDPEGHIIHDYSIYILYKGIRFHIHYGIKTMADFILPPGESEVLCSVRDEMGAVAELSVKTITAELPSEDAREEWKSKINLQFFAAEGKMELISQALAAEAYVDEEDRNENYLSFAEEVNAIWEKYKELEGIDTSYYTKEAREEIEAEVRDHRGEEKEKLAEINLKMLQSLEFLPFEVLDDAEVYSQAVSVLSETMPLNMESKQLLSTFIKDIYTSTLETEVPHPADKEIANMLLSNTMNCLSKTISDEMIGGNFLPSDLEEVYEFLSYNITQPNFFILYVEGSRWEVEEKVHMKKVEGVKNFTQGEVHGQVQLMKNISDEMTKTMVKDIMVGESPLIVETTSGFQLKVEKKYADEVAGETIQNEGTSITMPDACILLGQESGCEKSTPIGLVAVKWSSILETEGTDSVHLSPGSSMLDFSLTNREGNDTLKIDNASEPFEICLSLSPPSDDGTSRPPILKYVKPSFDDKDDFLVYHQLNVDKSGAAVKVEFLPEDEKADFVFFYAIGFKPSLSVYDGRHFMKNLQTEDGGTYSMLFSMDSQEGDEFFFAVGHLLNISSSKKEVYEDSKNLTRNDMTNTFKSGYSIGLYTTGCYFFSEENLEWSGAGCKVHSAKANMICCHCNHLTMFGSGFLIAPNSIDFSYVFAHSAFEDNMIIYLTLIITVSLFILLAIWSRWKDKKDFSKLGTTPLADNDMSDKYFYEILVQTGFQLNAGTKSKVHFILSGEEDETDVRTFSDDKREIFSRGDINSFVMSVPRSLGQLNYLRIWHDNSGKGKQASWYVKHIVVKDIISGYKYEFIVEKWFAVEEGDGMIDYLIPIAGKEQTTEFSHLFSNASRRHLTDNHLWLSIFTRPERSRFTRVQRLSCCMSVLYLSMLTDAMWYETTPDQPSPGAFKLGPLSLSPEQIGVGLLSNLIVFPPSFLIIVLFRKSRARKLRPSHVNIALENQYQRWRKEYSQPKTQGNNSKSSKAANHRDEEAHYKTPTKKKCLLPWWCVYIAWLLIIVSVASSLFFLWAYALQFGNEKTKKWLTSLMISFFSSVLLTEPLKIILIAIVMACLCGNPDVADDDMDDDEEDPHLKDDEEWLHNVSPGVTVQRPKYRPIDPASLEAARKLREKEVKMYRILREIGAYILYLWILMILSYGNRDPNNFFMREAIINGFIKPGDLWNDFNYVNTEVRFWNWTRNALIPELFAMEWYNKRPPLGLRLLLDDRNNFKIGYPVLRQVRARTDSCTVPREVRTVIQECAGYGNVINEDSSYYKKFWKSNLTMASRVPPEYKYMTASDLNGFPFWGQLDWYGGGGYIVPLIAKRYTDGAKLIHKMEYLERTSWIDKDTRAVFVEFGTYNPQVNLFVVVTIIAEFLPGGGIVPYYHIDPIRLLHYHTGAGLLQLLCQIGFVLFTVFYTFCTLNDSCKQGKKYFSEYWNLAEYANLLASFSIIGVEIYKLIITQRILSIFKATEGTGYIKLQEALLLDESFCYLIGFLMSLATLKFLKLLRFNKRIGSMISTVRLCAEELKGYSVCLMVIFIAFVCLFWMTLGSAVREFCSFISSFESSISMLLKKFNYYEMEAASPILAPLAFFMFAITASVILVNILLTIIIQSFEEVKQDVKLQNSEHQLFDFMLKRLKLLLGIGKDKSKVIPITFTTTTKNDKDVLDSFNGKVDRLLDFINSVYLDDQMDIEFLNKSRSQLENQLKSNEFDKKKSIPRKIPRYQSLHMKKFLDF